MPKKSGLLKECHNRQEKTWSSAVLNRPVLHIFLIAALCIIAYSNSFHVPFVFDDQNSITGNHVIRNMGNFFLNGAGYSYNPRRFIGYMTFALNYRIGGLDVTGYHIVNLAIHIINALLVYCLVVLTFRTPLMKGSALATHSRMLAFFTAALFTVHPVQTEAVTYIVQRLTSLAALFYMGSLYLYVRFRLSQESGGAAGWRGYVQYGLSVVSAVLAMKTKEIAFTLPIMIVLYESLFFDSLFPGIAVSSLSSQRVSLSSPRVPASPRPRVVFASLPRPRVVLYLLPVLATLLIIPLSMLNVGKPLGEVLSDVSQVTVVETSMPRWEYLMTELRVMVTYIRMLFLPVGQNLDYDYPHYNSLLEPQVVMSFVFLSGLVVLAVVFLRRAWRGCDASLRLVSFGILWFFITLAVESSIIPIVDVIFEHRLYLPSEGFFMAVAAAVFLLMGNNEVKRVSAAAAVMVAAIVALAVVTHARNTVWESDMKLWGDVVQKSPVKARGYNNLGHAYGAEGRIDNAIELYRVALKLNPDLLEALNNLGAALAGKDDGEAISLLSKAIALKPDYANARYNLGRVYLIQGRITDAVQLFTLAIKLKPDYDDAYVNLAGAYIKEGRFSDAIGLLEYALPSLQERPDAHFDLAVAQYLSGNAETALRELAIVEKHDAALASQLRVFMEQAGRRKQRGD